MDISVHFQEIRNLIIVARKQSFKALNKELIKLYWNIGKYIHQKVKTSKWGKSVVANLAEYLKETEPNTSGFSAQNLWQ
ncbi:MAG: DUF1016 N-terminal domain-containing protein [Chitinophagales bacterium]